ncbi:acyl carrier protein [Streptomyces acidiscabies]|uniref:acyl carrier protein n=1 Tax=Streptomyces acidiscabies TaxID=42234 RepID=UPI00095167D6|nr:phosphopantetheine-binding protein [Streptomyces acidiscabies]
MYPPFNLVQRLLVEECAVDPALVPSAEAVADLSLDPLLNRAVLDGLDRWCPGALSPAQRLAVELAADGTSLARAVQEVAHIQFLDLLIGQCGLPLEALSPDADFVTLDIDSLHLVELAVVMEERLSVQLPDYGSSVNRSLTLRKAAALFESARSVTVTVPAGRP